MATAPRVLASEWHIPATAKAYPGSARQVAEAYLRDEAASLGLGDVELTFRNDLALRSFTTIRLEQSYAGLPVLGGAAAVRVGADGKVRVVVLDVARNLSVALSPVLTEFDARTRARQWHGAPQSATANAKLAILPDEGTSGRLVWTVTVPSRFGARQVLVDAMDGRIVLDRSLDKHVLGRVYQISSVNTPTPVDTDLQDLVTSTPQLLNGWGGQLAVTNYVSGGSTNGNYIGSQTLVPNSGSDFLYDPPVDPLDKTDAFAQVGLYYHLTRMRNFFADTYSLDMSAPKWRVVAIANLLDDGAYVDNAFFSQPGSAGAPYADWNLVAVGQGTQFDFADDSDVFLHEFTHYINYNAHGFSQGPFETGPWGINPFPGGIDEGSADYYACTVNGDPLLGEASLAKLGAERDLTDTHKVCPDDVYGEGHMDGEIISSLSWTLRTDFGAATGDQLVWGALSLLTPGGALGDYGLALVQSAKDLKDQGDLTAADVTTVQDAVAQRQLDDCGHELELSPSKSRVTNIAGLEELSAYMGGDCDTFKGYGVSLHSFFHFFAQPAATDGGIRFKAELATMGGGDLSWGIYARRDQHVTFATSGQMPLPTVKDFDYKVTGFTGTTGELVIDANSTPAFDPTASYHIVIVHQNCPMVTATLHVEAAPSGVGGAGGSGGAGGEGGTAPVTPPRDDVVVDNGCGCRIGATDANGQSTGAGAWALLAALVPLGAVSRRRRRCAK